MDVPTIHVHTQSDKSTIGYVQFMWQTMRELANKPDFLRLSVHCMGPTAVERLTSLPNTKVYQVADIAVDTGLVGSMGHAACVEHAMTMTDDGDIHIVADSDTVVLAKGWDDYVRYELLDKGLGTFGTTYEDIGGFTSGAGTVQTYKNVPNVVWMALSPNHRWRDLRARPRKNDNLHITNEGQSKIYGLPIGYHVLRDVAWQIPEYLSSRGITYVGWKQLKPSKDATVLKGLSDYHEEYHVTEDDIPFVVHHRGSMRHAYRGDRISQNFYAAVDAWLVQEKARPTRWLWSPNDANKHALMAMAGSKSQATERIAEIEKGAGLVLTTPVPAPAVPNIASSNVAAGGSTIAGWLKATLDGNGVWSRYTTPVPEVINVDFTPELTGKNLRLEGTVSNVCITLPPVPESGRPHTMTIRNLTAGSVTLKIPAGRLELQVPKDKCWLILVDVDGVVHVE